MKDNLKTILVSATVTGLFTFLTTLLIDHYTAKQKRLLFDTQTSIPFQKDSLHVRIHNLELENDGDDAIEAIEGMVGFRGQHVSGYQVKGSPVLTMQDTLKGPDYHMRVSSLNPGEKVTFTFLVSGTAPVDSMPIIAIRAKGLSATEKKDAGRNSGMPLYRVLLLAILLAIALSSTVVVVARKRFRPAMPPNPTTH